MNQRQVNSFLKNRCPNWVKEIHTTISGTVRKQKMSHHQIDDDLNIEELIRCRQKWTVELRRRKIERELQRLRQQQLIVIVQAS